MATWDDVARLALALPGTEEATSYGHRAWKVAAKTFVWDRPLSKADISRFEGELPSGPLLAAAVDGLAEKEAVLAAHPDVIFTIVHFNSYPAVLIRLDEIDAETLEETITDAWLARAPEQLVADYLAER